MSSTLPREDDDQDLDWGPPVALTADQRVSDRWRVELERANKARKSSFSAPSPIDVMPDLLRVRGLPSMPWPPQWDGIARRCHTYPGDMIGVVGGTGSGKTQWAVQLARAFAAAGKGCVLWCALELTPADLALRIVANLTGTHSREVRERWTESQISTALATVTDRWRFVEARRGDSAERISRIDTAIDIATKIYGSPPLVVVDYVQLLVEGDDQRGSISDALIALGEVTERRGCYTVALSQTSRANSPALAGRVEVASASDLVGSGAESSMLERSCASMVVLNVFKLDDSSVLDAHWLVSKARHTGAEGREGARYHKAGGVWEELDHLPAAPAEVEREGKRRRKKGEAPAGTPAELRDQINHERADGASARRRETIVAALRAAGAAGLGTTQIRKIKGSGANRRIAETLAELRSSGRVDVRDGRWVFRN